MATYITKATFKRGAGKDQKSLPVGEEVSLKALGVSKEDADRYVELGLLAIKGKAAPAPDNGPAPEVLQELADAKAVNESQQKEINELQEKLDKLANPAQ